jgi:DNA-directed RNA polymerase sigma subunit (sigma70/sigma32)
MNPKEEQLMMLKLILTTREKQILSLRFGFDAEAPMTLAEVGKMLNMSYQDVRVIQVQALDKLSKHPRVQHLRDYLSKDYVAQPDSAPETPETPE